MPALPSDRTATARPKQRNDQVHFITHYSMRGVRSLGGPGPCAAMHALHTSDRLLHHAEVNRGDPSGGILPRMGLNHRPKMAPAAMINRGGKPLIRAGPASRCGGQGSSRKDVTASVRGLALHVQQRRNDAGRPRERRLAERAVFQRSSRPLPLRPAQPRGAAVPPGWETTETSAPRAGAAGATARRAGYAFSQRKSVRIPAWAVGRLDVTVAAGV